MLLSLLRKYQYMLFAALAFLVIASFTLFTIHDPALLRVTATTEDALQQDVRALCTLVSQPLLGDAPLCGDFLEEEIFQLQLLPQLAAQQPAAQAALQQRLRQAQGFVPYVHPVYPSLEAQQVWKQFCPQINASLEQLQTEEDSVAGLRLLIALYRRQQDFPAQQLQRTLRYWEDELQLSDRDPFLWRGDLQLFGFHTLEDWFSRPLLTDLLRWLRAVAAGAGHRVTAAEARADLLRRAKQRLQGATRRSEELLWARIAACGVRRQRAIAVWQELLTVRRAIAAAGQELLRPHQPRWQRAGKRASLDLYKLPAPLQLRTVPQLLELDLYLQALFVPDPKAPLLLPRQLRALEQIAATAPQLLCYDALLQVRHIELQQLLGEVSLPQIWDWLAVEKNWAQLAQRFPSVAASGLTAAPRSPLLTMLSPQEREKVLRFICQQVVAASPQLCIAALEKAPCQEKHLLLTPPALAAFAGINDQNALCQRLLQLPVGKEDPSAALVAYTQDGNHYYTIAVKSRSQQKRVLSFAEAQRANILTHWRQRHLQTAYQQLRQQQAPALLRKAGRWKPFAAVEGQLTRHLCRRQLDCIAALQLPLAGLEQLPAAQRLAVLRFYPQLLRQREEITAAKGEEEIDYSWQQRLRQQWRLEKHTLTLGAFEPLPWHGEELLATCQGQYSPLLLLKEGTLGFYRLLSWSTEEASFCQKLREMEAVLGKAEMARLLEALFAQLSGTAAPAA